MPISAETLACMQPGGATPMFSAAVCDPTSAGDDEVPHASKPERARRTALTRNDDIDPLTPQKLRTSRPETTAARAAWNLTPERPLCHPKEAHQNASLQLRCAFGRRAACYLAPVLEAVLFDLDGTLVDTPYVIVQTALSALAEKGCAGPTA